MALKIRRIDLHMHSLLSDGQLLPNEILRRAENLNYEAVAVTDHVDASVLESFTSKLVKVAEDLQKYWKGIKFIPGVELTHVSPNAIPKLALKAKKLGAKIVLVHGETVVEPVKSKTNHIAVQCDEVDILAHPGMITIKDARLARDHNVYLELTSRKGHCITNGHVAKVAFLTGTKICVNTDFHGPEDFISVEHAFQVALGAGLNRRQALLATYLYPKQLLRKIAK